MKRLNLTDITIPVYEYSAGEIGKITQVLANDALTAGIYKNESYVRCEKEEQI